MPEPAGLVQPVRIFVVGTPRSGTTLIQAMLASHPDVLSLPETHYFKKVWGRMWTLRRLGIVSPRAAARSLDRLMTDVLPRVKRASVPRWWPAFTRYGHAFAHVLDRASRTAGKTAWVDKSPVHLHCMGEITRVIPDARFVHVVRDGRDVAASLYERCMDDPERWIPQILRAAPRSLLETEEGRWRVLAGVVERWNADVRLSASANPQEMHQIISYGDVLSSPAAALQTLVDSLGLNYSVEMLDHRRSATQVLGSRASFVHMLGITEELHDTALIKWREVLTPAQRRFAEANLLEGGDVRRALWMSRGPVVQTAAAGEVES